MSEFRPIELGPLQAVPADGDPGAVPMLQWVDIASLVVDPAYQRDISRHGRENIRRIAAAFRWSRFSPVVCSPVAGGKLAIVDGQHRATAALLCGFDQVPCQIIIADRREQADAFRAINGAQTRVTAMQVHHAAVAAGDADAVALDTLCRDAGVTILRSNKPAERQDPGETHAVRALERCLQVFGADLLRAALESITRTSNNVPGAINSLTITALCQLLHSDETLLRHPRRLEIFDHVEIEQEAASFLDSLGAFRSIKTVAQAQPFVDILAERLRAAEEESLPTLAHTLATRAKADAEPPSYPAPQSGEGGPRPKAVVEGAQTPAPAPAPPVSAAADRVDVVSYLAKKNRIAVRTHKGWLIDAEPYTDTAVLGLVNKHRARADLPPVTLEQLG